jgi:probable F420-dependent oxidoreductase
MRSRAVISSNVIGGDGSVRHQILQGGGTTVAVAVSIFISHVDAIVGGDAAALVDLAVALEDAGADQVVLSEHVVLAGRIEAHGPGGAPFPFPPDHHYPEPLVALATIAGATSRIGLATGILIAPLRPAIVLAKSVATLDVLSRGRFELGVGAGWHEAELRAAGIEPAQATQVLEDTVGACRTLWAGGASTFRSPTISFEDLHCRPTPTRGAAHPVWFAGPPRRTTFARIARLGDGWLPFSNVPVHDIARGRELLDLAAIEHGRTAPLGIRASIPVSGATSEERVERAVAAAGPLLDAGATAIQVPLARLAADIETAHAVVGELARALRSLGGPVAG